MKYFHHTLRLLTLVALISASSVFAADNSGTWTKKAQKIAGTWSVTDGQLTLTDFSTRSAPDLKIFLSPITVGKLTNKNATDGAILVASLKSNKGDQSYSLPPDIDLTAYKSIIIHCKKYTKLWGAAPL